MAPPIPKYETQAWRNTRTPVGAGDVAILPVATQSDDDRKEPDRGMSLWPRAELVQNVADPPWIRIILVRSDQIRESPLVNLGKLLRLEIVRLASRAARQVAAPTKRAVTTHRRQIATLRKEVASLERELQLLRAAAKQTRAVTQHPEKVRFVAKGLVSLRKRLGLSAADFGRLVGTSGQSVYAWESRKTTPRKSQVAAIASLRGIGKREALARLELTSRP
jgi:DNA-binding transcriptional regulator YiaG